MANKHSNDDMPGLFDEPVMDGLTEEVEETVAAYTESFDGLETSDSMTEAYTLEELPPGASSVSETSEPEASEPEASGAEEAVGNRKAVFDHFDNHFAEFICRTSVQLSNEEIIGLSARLLSYVCRNGHTCLDIKGADDMALKDRYDCLSEDKVELKYPEADEWICALKNCSSVGVPGEDKPLILEDDSRLYLWRYYNYHRTIADKITKLSEGSIQIDEHKAAELIIKQFTRLQNFIPVSERDRLDRDSEIKQSESVREALKSRFRIITGGPGTGKTTTVSKLLAVLLELNEDKPLNIRLAAPTGKAAARMVESIEQTVKTLTVGQEVKDRIPRTASTIHRLLGSDKKGRGFTYNAQNPLELDVLIIDEASMISVAMMAQLCEALPGNARLILLGDENQLASVEPGSVLADLCSLKNNVSRLTISRRFSQNSGIGKLSGLINEQRTGDALNILTGDEYKDVSLKNFSKVSFDDESFKKFVAEGYSSYIKENDLNEKFKRLSDLRILCALREGPWGVDEINGRIEKILAQSGLIRPRGDWYKQLPIMITKNDYSLGLFNGDIGIVLEDTDENSGKLVLKAVFPDGRGGYKSFSRYLLKEYEKVFAMTVHKSQGSEFDTVVLMLPDKPNPVLTRELIYTAVTRAKETVHIKGSQEVLRSAIDNPTRRTSGLASLLVD